MTHLVLVGLMATGKSTVGRLVAQRLGRPLLDSDDHVEARTGRSVREIWRTDGEAAFRALESEALADALGAPEPSVIAAAGGVVLASENRELLRSADCEVVWLRARPETLLARLARSRSTHRPLLDDDPAGMLERMHRDRTALYADVADRIVDVDEGTHETVVAAVLDGLGEGNR